MVKTLDSIVCLKYSKDKIEVIVVNDPNDERSEEVVDLFRQNHPDIDVTIVPSINNASHAWNLGIMHSTGEILCVSPDDVIFHPESINRAVKLLRSGSKVAAVTFTCIFETQSVFSEIHHMRFIGNLTNSVSTIFLVTFYRKSTLETIGLYREDLGPPAAIHEDWELGSRIRKYGYTIILDGKIVQTHLEQTKKPSNETLKKPSSANHRNSIKKTLTKLLSYPNSYLKRNYRTFFVVMKSSPISQQLEYAFYFFMPLIGLALLVLVNFLSSLVYTLFLVVVIDVHSQVRGYYRVFWYAKRLTYPLVLVAVRVVRTYLSLLGLLRSTIISSFQKLKLYAR